MRICQMGLDWEFGDGQARPCMGLCMGRCMGGVWHGAWMVVMWWVMLENAVLYYLDFKCSVILPGFFLLPGMLRLDLGIGDWGRSGLSGDIAVEEGFGGVSCCERLFKSLES